ncbi:hypothetical protein FA95DRAFT_1606314 [Auriscalpium vulgare]|uniref:Uncharacterized protein n=1 Tax=Auriscalpium vulgare TaxID=40419 RepID=A0ACB8RSI5_9AGAM|nr:hypothetical protein FA95DRAFT_1606314 [Auriscalpium vulgare]
MSTPSPPPSLLLALPEELLSLILHLAAPDALPALLHTCTTTHRICTPLLYHTLHLAAPGPTAALARTLAARPALATHVRALTVASTAGALAPVLQAIVRARAPLALLDVTLDAAWPGAADADAFGPQMMAGERDVAAGRAVGGALAALADVRRLVVRRRKAYLSFERLQAVTDGLAQAVAAWASLESVTIAFRLSAPDAGPAAGFAGAGVGAPGLALAGAARLREFRTALPAVWNPAILAVSANPALERIVLTIPRVRAAGVAGAAESGVLVWEDQVVSPQEIASRAGGPQATLWMRQAWKHPRLVALLTASA